MPAEVKNAIDAREVATRPRRDNTTPSCVVCQQRKVKCDRIFPCTACTKSSRECTYTRRDRAAPHGNVVVKQHTRSFPLAGDRPHDRRAPSRARVGHTGQSAATPISHVPEDSVHRNLGASPRTPGYLGLREGFRFGSRPHSACLPGMTDVDWRDTTEGLDFWRTYQDSELSRPVQPRTGAENNIWTSTLLPLQNVLQPR